ncbi:MAG: carbohydrate ABC transporter permease [Clostridiales bacterium]|jgi:putative aldouronate transport system permease protein|nr:carbohydrate ABC transporter permease [Clostridiales bacterium]
MKKYGAMDRLGQAAVRIFLLLVLIATFFPFWNIFVLSLNDAGDTIKGGAMLWPRSFSLDSYKAVFANEAIPRAAKTSVARTAIGVPLTVAAVSMLAYGLSKRSLPGRRFISLYFIMTMYFSGGLIPSYMVIKSLRLIDTFQVFILPGLVNVFWMILVRTYMESLPAELEESAKLDGANDLVIFARIIFPLCLPIIATVVLFSAISHWNSWYDSYIYTSKPSLTTLSAELVRILNQYQTGAMMSQAQQLAQDSKRLPVSSESIRMAVTMVTTVPIILAYPFLQKYFIKGMMVGAVKG